MPIRDAKDYYAEQAQKTGFRVSDTPFEPAQPATADIFNRAFEQSFIGRSGMALAEHLYWTGAPKDPNYDPYESIINDGMEGYTNELYDVQSPEEYEARKGYINRSLENRDILANGGMTAIAAQLAWGTLDPVNMAPVLGSFLKGYRATKSVVVGAAAAGAVGGASQAGQELILSQIDPAYDENAGAMAIGANTILSGVLGPGIMAALSPELRQSIRAGFDDWSSRTAQLDDQPFSFGGSTTGAAQVPGQYDAYTKETLTPLPSLGIGRATSFIGPQTRLQASPSGVSRRYNAMINENALLTRGNAEGLPSIVPIEAERRDWFALESYTRDLTHQSYLEYRKSVLGKEGLSIVNDVRDFTGISNRSGVLTRQQFYDRVGMTMRRGDKAAFSDYAEANSFIEKAAGVNRGMSDLVLNEMINSGLFKDVPDLKGTAESWFRRMYNREKIVSDPLALEAGIARYYRQVRDADAARLPGLESELAALKAEMKAVKKTKQADRITETQKKLDELTDLVDRVRFNAKAIDEELDTVARTTVERIKGSPLGLIDYDEVSSNAAKRPSKGAQVGMRGTKERKLTIPDTYQWDYNGKQYTFDDFLVSDPTTMQAGTVRSVVPDLLIYKKFGTLNTDEILKNVTDDYSDMIAKAKTAKERSKLEKAKRQDLEDLRDSLSILRGTYANYDDHFKAVPTALRMTKQANYLALMGEMTISSAADVGSLVNQYGMRKVFGNLAPAFVKGMRSEVMKMATEDAKKFFVGLESVMNDRYAKIYDADIFAPVANRAEGTLNYLSGIQQKVSLMNTWLDALRPMAAILEQDRIVGIALKHAQGKPLTKIETAEIAAKFLNKNDLLVIAGQFSKHGATEGGTVGGKLFVPNMRLWDVGDATVADVQKRMRIAVQKEVDTLIIKPGSEIPKTIKYGGAASAILQFKSFMFSATNRLLTRSAQRMALGDQRLILGLSTMVALGMVSYALKAKIAGKDLSDKPQDWIAEGIDRSGILGLFGEVNNITEKLSGGNIGIRPMIGANPATRYINRNHLETFLGPTAGIVQDAGELIQSMSAHGNMTQSDLAKVFRHVPFQNALGLRYLFDGIEGGISDTFNLPEKR